MAAQEEVTHEMHEGSPGMDYLTGVYCVVFFALYLLYFYLVYIRWEVT